MSSKLLLLLMTMIFNTYCYSLRIVYDDYSHGDDDDNDDDDEDEKINNIFL